MWNAKEKKKLCGIVLFALVCVAGSYASAAYWIDDLMISPAIPTESEAITVDISYGTDAIRSWGVVYLEHNPPSIDITNNIINIDIYELVDNSVDFGFDLDETVYLPALPYGDYTLNIDLHFDLMAIHSETAQLTVTPEPTTIFLLGFGALALRRKKGN